MGFDPGTFGPTVEEKEHLIILSSLLINEKAWLAWDSILGPLGPQWKILPWCHQAFRCYMIGKTLWFSLIALLLCHLSSDLLLDAKASSLMCDVMLCIMPQAGPDPYSYSYSYSYSYGALNLPSLSFLFSLLMLWWSSGFSGIPDMFMDLCNHSVLS